MSFSGYVGGHKSENVRARRERHPELLVERAVRGLIPTIGSVGHVYGKLKFIAVILIRMPRNSPRSSNSPENNPMPETEEFVATGRRKHRSRASA
jgi:ribosomal protein L13